MPCVKSSGAGVIGSSQLPNMGAGNWAERNKMLLTTKTSL